MIAHRAVLASIHLTKMSGHAHDKALTSKILIDAMATASSGKWSTDLWPNGATKPIEKLDGEIRRYFLSQTLPWADSGVRLLPQSRFMEYSAELNNFADKRRVLVDEFIGNYDTHVRAARVQNGTLFRPECYPDRAVAKDRFKFASDIQPVPSAGDFRVSASADEVAEMEASLAGKIERATRMAERELITRLAEPLAKVIEKLSEDTDPGKSPIFRDSLITNIREIVDKIPDFNLNDNPVLADLHAKMTSVGSVALTNPELLRQSGELRSLMAQQANGFLNQLNDIFGTSTDD